MTEDELKAIEAHRVQHRTKAAIKGDAMTLVAEVRRLHEVERRHDALYAHFADVHAALGVHDIKPLTAADSVRRLVADVRRLTAERDAHWANFCERSSDFKKWRAAEAERYAAQQSLAELTTTTHEHSLAQVEHIEQQAKAIAEAQAAHTAQGQALQKVVDDCREARKALAEANEQIAQLRGFGSPKTLAESQAREQALRRALSGASDAAREFLNDVLDAKHLGVVDRGDARPLREISQIAEPLLTAPTDDTALREFGLKVAYERRRVAGNDDVAIVDAVLRGER